MTNLLINWLFKLFFITTFFVNIIVGHIYYNYNQSQNDDTSLLKKEFEPFNEKWNDTNETINIIGFNNAEWTKNCPCRSCSYGPSGDKEILCDTGGIDNIPFEHISPLVDVIRISAPNDKPNNLMLAPLFYRFTKLKQLRITKSNIPAIGPTAFRYRLTELTLLDLSQNRISYLIDSNFNGLSRLETLNLSFNYLSELASGTFQQLYNLKYLSLSNNRLNTITTRLFYNLTRLETLDLSFNPIGEIPPKNIIDLRPLKHLSLANCQLRELHSLFYRNLPNLKLLDLRDNQLTTINVYEFSSLINLRELYLNNNQISSINAYAFFGLNLDRLSLANNYLQSIDGNTFFNSTIVYLNISNNNFTQFDSKIFDPLADHLKVLSLNNIETLIEPSASITELLSPLKTLEMIELSNLGLNSAGLSANLFARNRQTLKHINLSQNSFVNISARLLEDLNQLETLDLSNNSLYELSTDFLYTLSLYKNLSLIFFDGNPWSCYRCHLLYFRSWITNNQFNNRLENNFTNLNTISITPANIMENENYNESIRMNPYQRACQVYNRCAICRYPQSLSGYQVDKIDEWQLEWCTDPTVQLRVSTTEPNVGLVLALLIIVILMIVIIGVIVYYRNRGAIYFTNEDLLYGRSLTENNKSSVYNISNAIKYFADATASPPEDSLSVASINSLYHPNNNTNQINYHPGSISGGSISHKTFNDQMYAQIKRNQLSSHHRVMSQNSYDSSGSMTLGHRNHGGKTRRLSSDVSLKSKNFNNNNNNNNNNHTYPRQQQHQHSSNSKIQPHYHRSNKTESLQSISRDSQSLLGMPNQKIVNETEHSRKTATYKQQRLHSSNQSMKMEDSNSSLQKSKKKVLMVNSRPIAIVPPPLSIASINQPPSIIKSTATIRSSSTKPNNNLPRKMKSFSQSSTNSSVSDGGKRIIKKKKDISMLPLPPPPPPTSTSPSTSSGSLTSGHTSGTDEEDVTNISENLPQPISTLCPYEEVEQDEDEMESRFELETEDVDNENNNDDESLREQSPSGSIDLSPETERPLMGACQHRHDENQDCFSLESLTTAAMAENGDSISVCSAASTGQCSLPEH